MIRVMRNSPYLFWYFTLFDLVSRERAARKDLDLRIIHAHLTMVLSTGILMWSYAFLAISTFSIPLPGIVGVVASLVHLFSPLLFLVTANGAIICNLALGAGFVHQLTFSYFSNGIDSHILMWLPILPLLAGFIQGRRCLLLWTAIITVAFAVFFSLHLSGFNYPNLISETGYHIAQAFLLFGWLFIIFCTTWVHVSMKEFSEETLRIQGQKIDDLFRVLFHDLANSLGRINIGMNLCERENNPPTTTRGLQIIRDAQGSMSEITQNVRRMYAVSKGKADVDLAPCSLNSCVEYVANMFASEMEKKNLKLSYDFERNKNLSVIVDAVSFNNQVLGNIFSNAIKFSHPGSEIRISSRPVNQNQVAVEITDTGIGMPEVLLRSLFDMNKRTSRQGTAGEVGTGFGMHIMKSFVEMYQGEIQIESVDREMATNSGTSIRLILKGGWTPGRSPSG